MFQCINSYLRASICDKAGADDATFNIMEEHNQGKHNLILLCRYTECAYFITFWYLVHMIYYAP